MVSINGYYIDANISEDHLFQSEVTEFPVEDGSEISDNIRNLPVEVTIEGVVSDSPFGNAQTVRKKETSSPNEELEFLPSEEALARLMGIRDSKTLVYIETNLKRYENMGLVSLQVPLNATTGRALRFTAVFRQITRVTNSRTTVRVAVPIAAKKSVKGQKTWTAKNSVVVVGSDGKPVKGVTFDEGKSKFVNADGTDTFAPDDDDGGLGGPSYDTKTGLWSNSNGTPVTQQQFEKLGVPVSQQRQGAGPSSWWTDDD